MAYSTNEGDNALTEAIQDLLHFGGFGGILGHLMSFICDYGVASPMVCRIIPNELLRDSQKIKVSGIGARDIGSEAKGLILQFVVEENTEGAILQYVSQKDQI